MNLRIEERGKAKLINLGGKFIIEHTEEFENKFTDLLATGPGAVAIECTNLEFIDSSGIGTFIKCLNHSKRKSTELFLVGVTENILNVLKLAKLDLFFTILTTAEFEAQFPSDTSVDDLIDSL